MTSTRQQMQERYVFTWSCRNASAAPNSIDTWDRCFLFLVYKEGTVAEDSILPSARVVVWFETNSQNHHIHIKCFFAITAAQLFHHSDGFNCLTKSQADVVVCPFSPSFGVKSIIVAVQTAKLAISMPPLLFSKTLEGCKFYTDVTTTDNGNSSRCLLLVLKFFNNFFWHFWYNLTNWTFSCSRFTRGSLTLNTRLRQDWVEPVAKINLS